MKYGYMVRGEAANRMAVKSKKKKKKKKKVPKTAVTDVNPASDKSNMASNTAVAKTEKNSKAEDAWEEHPIPAPPPVTKPAGPLRGSGKPKLRPWTRGGGILNIVNLPWHMRSPPKGESASRRKKREALLNRDMKYFEKLEEPL